MFLFDFDESRLAMLTKQAVVASINNLGTARHDSSQWYDFLGNLDPKHTGRCHFEALDTIEANWFARLKVSYRLLLGRTPESPRFEDQQISFSQLVIRILSSQEFLQKRSCIRYLRGPAFNRSPKLIFLHVPRTGGTYLTGALRSAMPYRFATCYDLSEPTWMLDAAFADVFSAHFSRSIFPNDAGHLFVAVVRPPRERFRSRADFYRLTLGNLSELPSYFLDEMVDGFQTKFIFGDNPTTQVPFDDPNTVVMPFEKINLIVESLFENGVCKHRPNSIFQNKSNISYSFVIPESVRDIIDNKEDYGLCEKVDQIFSLSKTLKQLAERFSDKALC
jgi:hypothetical protein